ncbi:unnamed protein product [Dracunculus medinensis]|uniref:CCHC-type domain-containing protein n=1 Tax=Dracunculus medinensis TaxID=318479 RepID=A0A0N4UIB4_DRAME|nr:unnamed protein product [Dracunculus medinensis]
MNSTPWSELSRNLSKNTELNKRDIYDSSSIDKLGQIDVNRSEELWPLYDSYLVKNKSEKKLDDIFKKLNRYGLLVEVKNYIRKLSKNGEIGGSQCGELIRRWRKHHRHIIHISKREHKVDEISESLEKSMATFDDVKKMLNGYVDKGHLSYNDAAKIIKKWKKRENRRSCFYCRQNGHKLIECPEKCKSTVGTGVCFKCGSAEHTSVHCKRKDIRGFPYATCFICKQTGHLSRDCEFNPNGIYPDGGSCNLCGSQKHLKRDCPELKPRKNSLIFGLFLTVYMI